MNNLTFGVEIECILPFNMQAVAEKLRAIGIDNVIDSCYGHDVSTKWKIVPDGSLEAPFGSFGMELVSPILSGENGMKEVRKLCNAIIKIGGVVNKSCGFHVHIGVQDQGLQFFKNLYKLYANFEPVLDGILPESRRGNANTYCRSVAYITDRNIDNCRSLIDLRAKMNYDRYFKLNLNAFDRQGTIEFRHHSGTLDSFKVISWISICMKMVNKAKKDVPACMKGEMTEIVEYVYPTKPAVRYYSKQRRIIDMLFRDKGVTKEEIDNVFPGNTYSIGHIAKEFNIDVRTENLDNNGRRGRPSYRFFVNKVELKTQNFVYNTPKMTYNVESFIEVMELDTLEAVFIEHRTAEFA